MGHKRYDGLGEKLYEKLCGKLCGNLCGDLGAERRVQGRLIERSSFGIYYS